MAAEHDATTEGDQASPRAATFADDAQRDKRFVTLRAKLALRGFVLVRSTDDAGGALYIVTKWAWTRQLHDLTAVEQFLHQAGAS